jgi:hypothetical protein
MKTLGSEEVQLSRASSPSRWLITGTSCRRPRGEMRKTMRAGRPAGGVGARYLALLSFVPLALWMRRFPKEDRTPPARVTEELSSEFVRGWRHMLVRERQFLDVSV